MATEEAPEPTEKNHAQVFAEIVRNLIKGQSNYIYWSPAVEQAKEFLKTFGIELDEPPTDDDLPDSRR